MLKLISALGIFVVAGCASLSEVDRSDLNHGLMNLNKRSAASAGRPLTQLGAARGKGAQAGGGCTVCAH